MDDKKLTVRAVERALDILLCFIHSNELSLTDIAQQTSLNKSTVHRLLASLEGKGFLMRDPGTEKYRLGFRIWELSANLTQAADPAIILLPELEKLRDSLGETISLYVRDGMERIRIQAMESNQSIRRVAPIGARMSLAVGASSKVLMAYADPHTQEEILHDPSWPDWVDKRLYKEQLEEIKEKGYATSIEERESGAAAVAVPIFNRSGHLIAALSVSGPSSRLTLGKMDKFLLEILKAASRMGKMVK